MYLITIKHGNKTSTLHEPDTESLLRLRTGNLSEEVNQIPKFDFSMTASNPYFYEELNDRKDIVTVKNVITDEVEFEGTILTHNDAMTSDGKIAKKAVCEGFLGYLCDSIQPYHHYEEYSVTAFLSALLDNHNASVDASKQIHLGSCDFPATLKGSKTTAYRNTLEEIRINLIERVGGELRIRRQGETLYLDFVRRLGVRSSTRIELARNMKSLEVDTDSTNIITRLMPLGYQPEPGASAKRLDIKSVNDGSPFIDDAEAMAKYGVICGIAEFDDITLPENLKSRGIEYLQNNNRVRKAYRAEILDLSVLDSSEASIVCGNTYHFSNAFMGLDEELRLMKRSVDIYRPYSPTVEIGDRAERASDVSVRTARLLEYDLPQQRNSILAAAKATATELIHSGLNGIVVVDPNEILIMDTPDKENANRVWRWNENGFGYSSTGYSGQYGTAITMDGAIVADFIAGGTICGVEIKNGNDTFTVSEDGAVVAKNITIKGGSINNGNGTFSVSPNGAVTASDISITGGSMHITTNDESYDVIQLSKGAWSIQLAPLQWKLVNTSINCEVLCQAGALYFKHNGETKLSLATETGKIKCKIIDCDGAVSCGDISSKGNVSITAGGNLTCDGNIKITSSGNVTCNKVTADELWYKSEGNTMSVANLLGYVRTLEQRIANLEG